VGGFTKFSTDLIQTGRLGPCAFKFDNILFLSCSCHHHQNCSSSRKLVILLVVIAAAVTVLGLAGIVSVVCFIVLSKDIEPFM